MAQDDLNVLSVFLAVAEERSFTRAAKRLNVSQSALSHAVRGLEEQIGVRLLARTTRSVAPTDAGEELLRSLRPALTDIRAALGKISGQRDKLQHRCINFRHDRDEIYRWEFDKGKRSLAIAVNGPLIVDDVELVIRAALDGVGLAYLGEDRAALHLDSGALVRVLEQWCQPFPGFFLYYPSRRQQPAALSALIDALRLENPRK